LVAGIQLAVCEALEIEWPISASSSVPLREALLVTNRSTDLRTLTDPLERDVAHGM
jgi:hypothetical protein